jgi:hypothetical protein
MTNRPCNPDSDLKRLWQMVMPGTPMPSCGTTQDNSGGHNATANTPAPESGKNETPNSDHRP